MTVSLPINPFRPPALRAAAVAALCLAYLMAAQPALAQRKVAIVRDTEIERLIRDYARPILKAAGLSKAGIDIILVNDPSFNAFVAGRRMFMNTGTMMIAETPNEVIGVIAHEAGHIAGGHQERLRQQIERAQTLAVVASLLGVGAVAAGAATGNRGVAGLGTGIAAGGSEIARRGLLSYRRGEETTADRSAVTYLNKTGQSAKGMIRTFQRFANALSLSGSRIDPYLVSHPLPRERIASLETLARQSRHWDKADPPSLQERHNLARVKIAAYTGGPGGVQRIMRNVPSKLAQSYGLALTQYLYGNPRQALAGADRLVKQKPKHPYFHELRGDILMTMNRPDQAATAYGRASRLAGRGSALLDIARGQALAATGRRDAMAEAVRVLKAGLSVERDYALGYRFLAQAYGALGDIAQAELASAEGNYYSGNLHDAKVFAARAQQKMKRGSPGWLRAQDIIDAKPPRRRR